MWGVDITDVNIRILHCVLLGPNIISNSLPYTLLLVCRSYWYRCTRCLQGVRKIWTAGCALCQETRWWWVLSGEFQSFIHFSHVIVMVVAGVLALKEYKIGTISVNMIISFCVVFLHFQTAASLYISIEIESLQTYQQSLKIKDLWFQFKS